MRKTQIEKVQDNFLDERQRALQVQRRLKMLEAIDEFSRWKAISTKAFTVHNYDNYLKHIAIFLRNPDIETIKLEQILEYISLQVMAGFKSVTIEKKIIALKKFFEFYNKLNYKVLDYELIPLPEKKYTIPRVANEEDFEKLINAIPDDSYAYYHIRNKAFIHLLYDTGARLGEILALNVADIDVEGKKAISKTEKVKTRNPYRKIFWTDKTTKYLKRWLAKRNELLAKTNIQSLEDREALFISVNGGVCGDGKTGRRMDIGAAGEMIRKYSRLAGLKYNLNAHSFRHRLGHELAKKGANNSTISSILGHSNIASTFRYTILEGREVEEQYRKFIEA